MSPCIHAKPTRLHLLQGEDSRPEKSGWMCPESQTHHRKPTEKSSSLPSSAVLSNYSTLKLYCHQRNYLVWESEQREKARLSHPKRGLKNERRELWPWLCLSGFMTLIYERIKVHFLSAWATGVEKLMKALHEGGFASANTAVKVGGCIPTPLYI